MVQVSREADMILIEKFTQGSEGMPFRELCQGYCERLRAVDRRYDWVGIYWLDGDVLVLGPWSGRQATDHQRIRISEGICGAAVRNGQTVMVADVRSDPRYLSCFLETRSEIVVPIRSRAEIIGEIDIDGTRVGAFGDSDRAFLEALADHIGSRWPGRW